MSTRTFGANIEFARKLQGHVEPYLVIGLRMGVAAKKALNITDTEAPHLQAEATLPMYPPFSCLRDGMQVSTTCTVGNQRLQIKNGKIIRATFIKEEISKIVKIKLTKQFREQLDLRHKQDSLDEAYAWEIAELLTTKSDIAVE